MSQTFALGDHVRTVVTQNQAQDWLPEVMQHRRFPTTGIVIKEHNSPGLCYAVKHDYYEDTGYYEPHELELAPGGAQEPLPQDQERLVPSPSGPLRPEAPAMTPWITCNLPWSNTGFVTDDRLPPPPDLSAQEKAQFGVAQAEIHDAAAFERLGVLLLPAMYLKRKSRVRAAEERLAKKAGMSQVLVNMRLCQNIEMWRRELPEYKAYLAVRSAEFDRLQAGDDALTFKGQGLAVPGTQVEVDGKAYLIGNINPNRGLCDDCTAFDSDAIVTRHRVLCSPEELVQ